jgi:hypothetical protein
METLWHTAGLLERQALPKSENMKTIIIASLLLIMACSGCAPSKVAQPKPIAPYLPGIREFLQGFVDMASENEADYFFVSPVVHGDSNKFAHIYWMTKNWLIYTDVPTGKMASPGYEWCALKQCDDLAKDVVPTPQDLQMRSSHQISSDEVEASLRECLGGVKIIIEKKKGPSQLTKTRSSYLPGEFQIRNAFARPAARAYYLLYAAALERYQTNHDDELTAQPTMARLVRDAKAHALRTYDHYKEMVGNIPTVVDRKRELEELEYFEANGDYCDLMPKIKAYIKVLKQ